MIIVADTSGLIAALNTKDPEHAEAAEALGGAGLVIISPLVLVEIDYVVSTRASRRAAGQALDAVHGHANVSRVEFAAIDADVLGTALSVRRRYQTSRLDIADAVNVALAARYRTNAILTLDRRDFRAIRPLSAHPAFRLLPDDL